MIIIALRTNCPKAARAASRQISAKLDQLWAELRLKAQDVPAAHLLLSYVDDGNQIPKISEALDFYLMLKGADKGKVFRQTSERAVKSLIDHSGDMSIDKYTRIDANRLRDLLLSKGLAPQSVKRLFSVIRTVFGLAINEHALICPNVFAKVEFGNISPVRERPPIPIENIKSVQSVCMKIDDSSRWLIALISDTGMRLAEALGLSLNDFKFNTDHPHIELVSHPWRRLKTNDSARTIPLVGASFWAANRLMEGSDHHHAFPKYVAATTCKANSASATLNKWLNNYVPEYCVIHSFRHSFRDRLRAVQCPADVIDQLGGWKTIGGVGHSYGKGYPIEVLAEWMNKIIIDIRRS